jgi:MOSC domain-containing protein YiiM
MTGTIQHLFLKTAHEAPMQVAANASAVTGQGLEGDISFGQQKRQVLMIEEDTLREFALEPGLVRENVVVSGIQLAGLPAGTQVRAGEATLEVTMDCAPCEYIESLRPGLQAALDRRRGTLFRVIEGGPVRVGDSIAVLVAEAA